MDCRICLRLGLCSLFFCCLSAIAVRAAQSDVPSFINPAHRAVVRSFLRTKPYLRVATYADAENKERLGSVSDGDYGENKSPYYAVGDFNHDGREDFAIAFVNTRQPQNFALAVFNGPFRGRKWVAPAYYNEKRFGTDDFLFKFEDEGKDGLQISIPGGDMTPLLRPKKRGRGYYVSMEMTQ